MPRGSGIGPVVRPRELTYNVTCHQWFNGGQSAIRILPTICVHMCKVRYVSCHSCKGNGGHRSDPLIPFSLAKTQSGRYPVVYRRAFWYVGPNATEVQFLEVTFLLRWIVD